MPSASVFGYYEDACGQKNLEYALDFGMTNTAA